VRGLHVRGRAVAAGLVAASCLLSAPAWPAAAQGPRGRGAERRAETMRRQGEQFERDELSRDRAGPEVEAAERRRTQALTEQVRHDLEGLQAGYNRIVLAMASGEGGDSAAILDAVSRVRKAAGRLRENLALPRAEGGGAGPRREPDAGVTGEPLLRLRKHIYSFVTNPLFEAAPALDLEQAGKAARDLDEIISLSEGIRKSGTRPKRPRR